MVGSLQGNLSATRLELLDALNQSGKHCEEYVTPDGSTLLLLQHGGRVLGLFPKESDENFYWTHPALASPNSALNFYRSEKWHNSGGDRTWVAPEVDIFFPNFPRTDPWAVPSQLDPGTYRMVQTEHGRGLTNRFNVTLSRLCGEVEVEIAKSWSPAPNPLRHDALLKEDSAYIEFAGYEQQTSLRLLKQGVASAGIGLWNLLQLPHGGEALIPTYFRSKPKVYFGNITSEETSVSDHLVRFRMREPGSKKIGIEAIAATGRIAYICKVRSRWSLVVRNFSVNPSGEYVDIPWEGGPDRHPVYVVQVCSVNNELGQFSELEYHAPAICLWNNRNHYEDISQVWAFRGSLERIRLLAKRLIVDEA